MSFAVGTYDLHITVDPTSVTVWPTMKPWQIHDIHNVQGIPHFIISQKYVGLYPHDELRWMAEWLKHQKIQILREKVEQHFPAGISPRAIGSQGVVEVHYKCTRKGVFEVSEGQIRELNEKKFAFSFNKGTSRPIISVRFADTETYAQKGIHTNELPSYLEEVECEVVVADTNEELDSFWPMRTLQDKKLTFSDFPKWLH